MSFLMRKKSTLGMIALGALFIVYIIWANIPQVQAASGSWSTDFGNPRRLVGYADAVFLGRVTKRWGGMSTRFGPQTGYTVEVLHAIKSVHRQNPQNAASLPAIPAVLPSTLTLIQYGGFQRSVTGKLTLVLMDEEPLLEPGQTYVLATRYDSNKDIYLLLPRGSSVANTPQQRTIMLDKLTQAVPNEIPFDPSQPINPNQ
jgi:hypothetical protein